MKRVLTALVLVPLAVYAVVYADWRVFLAVIALVSALCFHEYCRITGAFAPLGYVAGLLLLLAPPREASLIFILTGLAAMAISMAAADLAAGVNRAGALSMGVLYVFGSWKSAVLLHDVNVHWLLFGLMVNWIGDTAAYYVGRRFGKRQILGLGNWSAPTADEPQHRFAIPPAEVRQRLGSGRLAVERRPCEQAPFCRGKFHPCRRTTDAAASHQCKAGIRCRSCGRRVLWRRAAGEVRDWARRGWTGPA